LFSSTAQEIPELDRETFGAALQMHRTRLGLTQAEAAGLLEVSPRVYWQWEKGKSNAQWARNQLLKAAEGDIRTT
jgi:DNA-binding XRE family transcriptional regulator